MCYARTINNGMRFEKNENENLIHDSSLKDRYFFMESYILVS